jgi:hypothetical protein
LAEAAATDVSELKRQGQQARQRINLSASLDAVTDKLIGHYVVASVPTAGMQPAK